MKMTYFYVLLLCYITSLQFIYIDCEPADSVLQQQINIDLSTYNKWNQSSHVFIRNFSLAEGNAIVDVINSPNNRGFFVIQAHSLYVNITLSTSATNSIKGTNVGLVQKLSTLNPTFRFYIKYVEKPIFEKVLVAVVMYEKEDPIPGGCNMVFNTEYAPYQLIHYNDNMVQLDVQPAYVYNHICEENQARLSVYHSYLYERNLNENVYFDFIINMLTPDKIQENGKLVPLPVGHSYLRRYFSAYPGVGTVYAVIAQYGNLTSAYVPAVTYACNINNWDIDCVGPVTIPWKILCSLLLFMGVFTCYFGHRFFKTQMFLFGFVFGGFVSFISASLNNNLSVEQGVIISALFGAIYGATWIILWWRFGSPVLSVFLPVAFIGYLTSCIVFYSAFGDLSMFQSNLNYWGTFFSIALPITLVLLVTTMFANILACSVLGATAVVVSLDNYIGGNLHYIIVNNVRRATVSKFNFAVLNPPFQYRDLLLILLWIFLVLTGVYAQMRQQRGKPPFPPPIAALRVYSERTPLLSGIHSNNRLSA